MTLTAALLLAGGHEAQAQRAAQATITVSVTVVAPVQPDTLRTPLMSWPAIALPAGATLPAAADTLEARRSRLVLAYTGV